MTTLADLPIKQINCDICNKEIWSCARCRHCHQKWCGDCAKKQYDCIGPNHHYSEECCEQCVPKYGRIVDDKYYCPSCAPESEESEYKFKYDSYQYQNKILRRDRIASGLECDYLNNPENWQRYEKNHDEIEEEWERMMTYTKKLKDVKDNAV